MRKAFAFVPHGVEVDSSGDSDVTKITDTIIERTVMVVTDECVGEAVVVAGKIITSLFLVRNYCMVKIILSRRWATRAIVARRDELNYIAELKPALLIKNDPHFRLPSEDTRVNRGPIGEHGAPLLTPEVRSGTTVIIVAGMRYVINVCERREEDAWKVKRQLPAGLVGGGIWNLDGEFVGLSLATKVSYTCSETDVLLALPAEDVLNFAETS